MYTVEIPTKEDIINGKCSSIQLHVFFEKHETATIDYMSIAELGRTGNRWNRGNARGSHTGYYSPATHTIYEIEDDKIIRIYFEENRPKGVTYRRNF